MSSLMVVTARLGVGAEFESTMKMKSENESENDQFCKIEGKVRFFKNDHFWFNSRLILKKNEL